MNFNFENHINVIIIHPNSNKIFIKLSRHFILTILKLIINNIICKD